MKKSKKLGKLDKIPRLDRARERFERWRQRRKHIRERIPDGLWLLATELAEAYGINRTARVLGLQYDKLKERVSERAEVSGVKFVEVAPAEGVPFGAGSVVELERAGGAKLRIQFSGGSLDVAALVGSFLESRE